MATQTVCVGFTVVRIGARGIHTIITHTLYGMVHGGDHCRVGQRSGTCVKVWRAGSSGMLGGILGIQGSCLKTIQLSKKSSNTSSPKKNNSIPIVSSADILKNCSIRWTSRQTVLLTLEDGRKVNLKVL